MSRFARAHPDDRNDWTDLPVPVAPAFPPKCKCSHPESTHGTDRKGRYGCFNVVCGCTRFRPEKESDQ